MLNRRQMLAATAATALVLSAGASFAEGEKVKVGFIYVGPTGDFGWTYQHDQGRKALEAKFGDKIETSFVESVPEGADAERVLRQMASAGTNLIFTTSFGYMDPTIKAAAEFPDVKFEHSTGFKRADNVATYNARFYQGRHAIGLMAGRITKSNKIGYIASFPIPEVIQGINAAYLAAKSVNPAVEFKIVWVSTWFDPGKEADAANALIDQGVDVIMQHTDSPAAMTIAEEKGIHAFGQASDMVKFGPKAQLTAIVDNWDDYYVSRVQAVIDGTWTSTDTWGGVAENMVNLAPFGPDVPAEVAAEATAAMEAMKAGTFKPFTGPLNKQDGSVWLKEGETADDATLSGLNFYVEGIVGELPK